MHFLKALVTLASLVLLISGANAEDQRLTGSEAIQAITGSTITVAGGPDGPVSMYIGDDHKFDSLEKGEIDVGKWFEKDQKFCIEHSRYDTCFLIAVVGTQGHLRDDSREVSFPFTIEAGNQVDDSAAN